MHLPLLAALYLTLTSLTTSAPIAIARPGAAAIDARSPADFQCPEGCPVGRRDALPQEYGLPVGISKRDAVEGEYEAVGKREAGGGA
ncbi:hypothetical protein MMC26_007563 [Xylographa opegraphella]|nr:hypothetical protein [Xylographa opegraphella]